MATKYYEDAKVVLYHGDCNEVLPTLDPVDLCLTDPPYGIAADAKAHAAGGKCGWTDYGETNWDSARPDAATFRLLLAAARHSIIWGGNYFADLLPPSMGWLAWDKGQRGFSLADFELAWTSYQVAARCVVVPRAQALQDGKQHPTQKSLKVMSFCIQHAIDRDRKPIQTIIDPFAGSGTTLRAAKDLGLRAIGIEAHEPYCEIIATRMGQETLF